MRDYMILLKKYAEYLLALIILGDSRSYYLYWHY